MPETVDAAGTIGVAIRIRPFNGKERARKDLQCWSFKDETASRLVLPEDARAALQDKVQKLKTEGYTSPNFGADSCFGADASTGDIYAAVGKRVVDGSLRGVNGTILAYGQTSSGKTHTMLGDREHPGVVRLAVQDVFKHIDENDERHFFLKMSMCEIYNEVVADLLQKDNKPLNVFTARGGRNVIIKNITEETITSPAQVWELLDKGFQNRSVSGTEMNAVSSRSHTVIRIVVQSRKVGAKETDKTRKSTLNMVDLAGSERTSQAGTHGKGQRFKEGTKINTSLLTLGTVIKKLMKAAAFADDDANAHKAARKPKRRPMHIPYRNSMLTRVLAKSLGGNAQTGVICTLAPSHMYYADSRITLSFAANACKVKVKARVNEVKKEDSELGIFQDVAQKLKAQLRALPAQIGADGAWPAGAGAGSMPLLIGPDGSPLAPGSLSPAQYEAALLAQHMRQIVPGAGPGGVLPGSAEFEAAALASAEAKTSELREDLQAKIKHLESLILCANKPSGLTDEDKARDGLTEEQLQGSYPQHGKKSSRKCRRLTVAGSDVARNWARGLIRKRCSFGGMVMQQGEGGADMPSPFEMFRKQLDAVTEDRGRDSCGSDDTVGGGDGSSSTDMSEVDAPNELTMAEAMEEIESLYERVEGEEQDRILAEEQLFNLQMQLAMLRDGAGINNMAEKELDELYDFHEEGMLRVVEERNRRKSKFAELQDENAELRRQLAEAQQAQQMMASPQEHETILQEKDALARQLSAEKQGRLEAEMALSEERDSFAAEKARLREQALEDEKSMRAWHKLDIEKRKLQLESIVSQSPGGPTAPSSRKKAVVAALPRPRFDGGVDEGKENGEREQVCSTENCHVNKALAFGQESAKKSQNKGSSTSGETSATTSVSSAATASAKTVSFSPSVKQSSKVDTPTTKDKVRYKRTPMRGFFR